MKRNSKDKNKKDVKFNLDDINLEAEDNEKYSTDDDDLIEEEQKLLKKKKKLKLVKVFDLLGKPVEYTNSNNGNPDKTVYINLLTLLEKQNIIVHFNNEYSLKEKYDFITNEVFNQFVENDRSDSSRIFVYEDYHPEKYSELDDDEEFI